MNQNLFCGTLICQLSILQLGLKLECISSVEQGKALYMLHFRNNLRVNMVCWGNNQRLKVPMPNQNESISKHQNGNWHIDNQFFGPLEVTFGQTKGGKLYNITQRYLGQSKGLIFCISLHARTCNVWRYMLSRICRIIRRHFKCSLDTLIMT